MNNLQELKPVGKLSPFAHFCCTIGNLPTSYMISLTYEEQLLWLCNYLEKTVIPAVNTNAEAVAELQNLYIQLKEYVDNYFTNLNVQEEINNKLDEMAQNGTLSRIINQEIFNNLNNQIETNTANIKKRIRKYNTFSELMLDETIQAGDVCETNVFYSLNDNGNAKYLIVNTEDTNEPTINLQNGLFAQIIVYNNIINVK